MEQNALFGTGGDDQARSLQEQMNELIRRSEALTAARRGGAGSSSSANHSPSQDAVALSSILHPEPAALGAALPAAAAPTAPRTGRPSLLLAGPSFRKTARPTQPAGHAPQ
jgi:hypothetical protein